MAVGKTRPEEPENRPVPVLGPLHQGRWRKRADGGFEPVSCFAVAAQKTIQRLRMRQVQAAAPCHEQLAPHARHPVKNLHPASPRGQDFCREQSGGTGSDNSDGWGGDAAFISA